MKVDAHEIRAKGLFQPMRDLSDVFINPWAARSTQLPAYAVHRETLWRTTSCRVATA